MTSPLPDDAPFARTALLLSPPAMECLAAARVLVVGAGAVGSAAALSLVRSGLGALDLVDFDPIRPSNLNRHPFAYHSTLGLPKTEAAARFLLDVNPGLRLTLHPLFVDAQTAPPLLESVRPLVLIDAIDSLLPKTELLLAAQAAGIPLILSCMGAARKRSPLHWHVDDLLRTRVCPLAHLLRKRLRRRGIRPGIRCIYSTELPAGTGDLPPPDDPALPPDFLDRGRRRPPLGSLHAVTATAGLLAAATAIDFIVQPPETTPTPEPPP